MRIDRRQLNFGLMAAAIHGFGSQARPHEKPAGDRTTPASGAGRPHYFFANSTFEMIFLNSLGRAYHSGGNIGKVLYLTSQVEDGNFESVYTAFLGAGDEARALAENSVKAGHRESARQATYGRRTSTIAQHRQGNESCSPRDPQLPHAPLWL